MSEIKTVQPSGGVKRSLQENSHILLPCLGVVLFVAIILVQSSMESKTYNKLTGAKTTWWDAVWVDLRVVGDVK